VSTATAYAAEPIGTAFGKPCAAAYLIVVPGSYETEDLASMSTAVDSMFDKAEITEENTEENTDSSVGVHYIDYPAQIFDALTDVAAAMTKSPLELGGTYKESKDNGYEATWSTMNHYGKQCVDAKFVLVGYSQGAHIAGDIAATIADESTPVSADRVRGVHLLADPARDGGYEPLVGDASGSDGLAVLAKLNGRNFGSLSDRTIQAAIPGNGELLIADVTTLDRVNQPYVAPLNVTALAARDGDGEGGAGVLVTGDFEGDVRTWRLGRLTASQPVARARVVTSAVDETAGMAVSSMDDFSGSLEVRELSTGKLLYQRPEISARSMALAPHEGLDVVAQNGDIEACSMLDLTPIWRRRVHSDAVTDLRVWGDVVTSVGYDHALCLSALGTGEPLCPPARFWDKGLTAVEVLRRGSTTW
jgi:hypothetical protein